MAVTGIRKSRLTQLKNIALPEYQGNTLNRSLRSTVRKLVERGEQLFNAPKKHVQFTSDADADDPQDPESPWLGPTGLRRNYVAA
jgi:hypothetical protein